MAPLFPGKYDNLGIASRHRRNGWFKSVTRYEDVAHDILAPHLPASDAGFRALINRFTGGPMPPDYNLLPEYHRGAITARPGAVKHKSSRIPWPGIRAAGPVFSRTPTRVWQHCVCVCNAPVLLRPTVSRHHWWICHASGCDVSGAVGSTLRFFNCAIAGLTIPLYGWLPASCCRRASRWCSGGQLRFHLIVDEYRGLQPGATCTGNRVINGAARPCVLGDPMQAILALG